MVRAVCLSFVAYRPHVTPRTRDESRASLSRKSVLFEPGDARCSSRRFINQDKKTEKIEMLQSHEALYSRSDESKPGLDTTLRQANNAEFV